MMTKEPALLDFQTGKPTEVGEYQASMDPPPMPSTLRYFWDGKDWCGPYHTSWRQEKRDSAMKNKSQFQECRYWRKVD